MVSSDVETFFSTHITAALLVSSYGASIEILFVRFAAKLCLDNVAIDREYVASALFYWKDHIDALVNESGFQHGMKPEVSNHFKPSSTFEIFHFGDQQGDLYNINCLFRR